MKGILLFLIIFCCVHVFSQELSISELENNIKNAELEGNVGARSVISQYWQLVDIYFSNKNYEKAYEVVIRGLQLDPWNYKYQKIAADIEIMSNDYQKANNRFNVIINNLSELAKIYEDSVKIQSTISVENFDEEIISLPRYYVYIATFPDVNTYIVDAVAANISSMYGIGVKIINVGADEYRDNMRNRQEELYDMIVDDVRGKNSKDAIANFLAGIGLTEDDLQTLEGKEIFAYRLLSLTETGKQQLQLIEMTTNQYSANALLDQLRRNFANYNNEPHCLGILGITKQDIYENDFNFLFGWAKKKWGIISYARFVLGNPEPTYEQFEKRTIIQSLSSIGFVIGIPRPTSPNCVRAYPNSLAEMDRKTMELCPECKTNLRECYSGF